MESRVIFPVLERERFELREGREMEERVKEWLSRGYMVKICQRADGMFCVCRRMCARNLN